MAETRRRFLKLFVLGTGGLAIAGGATWRYAKASAAAQYRRIVELPRTEPTGVLPDPALRTMMAATFLVLGKEIDDSRYEDFFRWKSENASGYRALYERFQATVDGDAKKLGAPSFAEAPEGVQRQVMAKARAVRQMINEDDKVGGVRFMIFDRDWLLYERYVVRELLTLFAHTDAWTLSGYGQPPGVPRTVESYLSLPEGAEAAR